MWVILKKADLQGYAKLQYQTNGFFNNISGFFVVVFFRLTQVYDYFHNSCRQIVEQHRVVISAFYATMTADQVWVQNPTKITCFFFEHETLSTLLCTGWFPGNGLENELNTL